jgi:GYF domain 2
MDGNWYYAQDNKSFGPFSWAEFTDVAASGTLRRTSIVWREGMTEGVVASTVNHLFPVAQALRGR